MNNFESNVISVNDVLRTLRECSRNDRYEGMFGHMLTFASELTGLSEDALLSSINAIQTRKEKQPDPWEELYKKYPTDRGNMSEDEEKRFVDECYTLYEKKGFSSVFWTPWSDQQSRNGQSFEVVERCTPENRDLCTLPMWKIRFSDGTVVEAYPEEIIPREMRANGCPLFGNEKSPIDSLIQSAERKLDGAAASDSPARESEAVR